MDITEYSPVKKQDVVIGRIDNEGVFRKTVNSDKHFYKRGHGYCLSKRVVEITLPNLNCTRLEFYVENEGVTLISSYDNFVKHSRLVHEAPYEMQLCLPLWNWIKHDDRQMTFNF